MNNQSQILRESKDAIVWFVIPFLCLIAAGKILWQWLASNQIESSGVVFIIFLLAISAVCWRATKKYYTDWLNEVNGGNSDGGKVLYSSSTKIFNFTFGTIIQIVVLIALTTWVIVFTVHLESVLILLYSGLIWFFALSAFMKSWQYFFGVRGLWVALMGVKVFISFSSIEKAIFKVESRTKLVSMTLYFINHKLRPFKLPGWLSQDAVDAIKGHFPIEMS